MLKLRIVQEHKPVSINIAHFAKKKETKILLNDSNNLII